MTYTLVIPPELLTQIYNLREAGLTPSIRNFIITAIESKLKNHKKLKGGNEE